MVSELIIGARGWQYSQWLTRFYPDDMPEDWRFSYYCNEFQSVLLPQSELLGVDADAIEDWRDDIGEDFSFFIELDQLERWRECLEQLEPLQNLIGGFVLRPDTITETILAQCVPELGQWAPVCLDERLATDNNTIQKLIHEYKLGCCWDALNPAPAWKEGDLSVALLAGGFDYEPRRLREVLENCLRNTRNKPNRALFITGQEQERVGEQRTDERQSGGQGEAPSIETLRQAIQLRDLIE